MLELRTLAKRMLILFVFSSLLSLILVNGTATAVSEHLGTQNRPGSLEQNNFFYQADSTCPPVTLEYLADELPENSNPPWLPFVTTSAVINLTNGFLNIDTNSDVTESASFRLDWGLSSTKTKLVEARMRLDSFIGNLNAGGAAIWVEDDLNAESLIIRPGSIRLYAANLVYNMNTTDDYHTYRISVIGNDIKVYVDGNLAIDGSGVYGNNWWQARNHVDFW